VRIRVCMCVGLQGMRNGAYDGKLIIFVAGICCSVPVLACFLDKHDVVIDRQNFLYSSNYTL
jgi:hypothetical protein